MPVLQIDQEKCRNCLKCMQECPVTAISLVENRVSIDSVRCVTCGKCLESCAHGAIVLEDQVELVKGLLAAGRKVIFSIDPACRVFLPEQVSLEQLAAAIQKLGGWDTADGSEAAVAVASEYARLLREKHGENVILSACPVVRNMLEQYYAELVPMLAPVASPMIAHGRMLKRDFTSAAVIYVTTCIARLEEMQDVRHSTEINGVLTIWQLLRWLDEAGILPTQCSAEPLLSEGGDLGSMSAVAGGLLECVEHFLPKHGYRAPCGGWIGSLCGNLGGTASGESEGICVGALCLPRRLCRKLQRGGKTFAAHCAAELEKQLQEADDAPYFDARGVALLNPVIARAVPAYTPSEEEIQAMLFQIGVGNPRQQQNCGACGYETCRMRAEAILEHRENVSLCRQVVQEARRDVFCMVYESLPMAAILVDENQKVVGFNREAGSLFSMRPDQEKYIFELMDPGDFQYVLDTGLSIKNRRMDIPEIFMRVEVSLVPLKELHMVLGLFQDITEEEEAEAKQQSSRLQSVEMAQKVIEKQMTVAQQIAFLLGETTAETKVTLNHLKQRILGEEEDS